MANNSLRVSQLGQVTSLSANDRLVVLTNSDTSAQTQTIAFNNLTNSICFVSTTKANTSPGTSGQICFDTNYIYVCVANNVWKRAALTTY